MWSRFRPAAPLLLLAVPLSAQQSAPPVSANQSSSSPDAPVQQQQPAGTQTPGQELKPESKVKQKLKDLEPQCVGISGGAGKCRHTQGSSGDAKREEQERQLRQQCNDAANQHQPQCVELRKHDSARDTSVGDEYLSDKHYPSAVNRFRLALQEDPSNSTAMLHLAQALEKSGNKAAGCEQYQHYLQRNTNPPDEPKDRDLINHLQHSCSPGGDQDRPPRDGGIHRAGAGHPRVDPEGGEPDR